MEVTIGVQNLPREITIDVDLSKATDITSQLQSALKADGVLELTDTRGRTVVVPAAAIGYIEIGPQESRKVGFGSL
jgi:hypothetical protein